MAKPVVRISSRGARELMNREDVQKLLLERADAVAERAGPGFEADVQPGRNRAHAIVKSTDVESRRQQAKHNVLLKSIDAAR